MGSIKTRIWPGGLADIQQGDAARAARTVAPSESDEPDTAVTKPVPAASLLAATTTPSRPDERRATRIHGWWEVKTAPDRETRERLASTRIMPIEQLLGRGFSLEPPPPVAAQAEAQPMRGPAADVAKIAASTSPVRLRVALAIGLCAVSAVLCWVPPGSLAAAPAPARSLSTVSVPVLPPAAGAATSERVAATPTLAPAPGQHAPSASTTTVRVPGRERAAVDALIAGDYGRARDLYRELAETGSEPSAFGEAARILSERLKAAHESRGTGP